MQELRASRGKEFVPRITYGFSGFSLPFIAGKQERTQQHELKPRCTILLSRAIPRLDRVVEDKDHYLTLEPVS
jgi:hypothetical protein